MRKKGSVLAEDDKEDGSHELDKSHEDSETKITVLRNMRKENTTVLILTQYQTAEVDLYESSISPQRKELET